MRRREALLASHVDCHQRGSAVGTGGRGDCICHTQVTKKRDSFDSACWSLMLAHFQLCLCGSMRQLVQGVYAEGVRAPSQKIELSDGHVAIPL